MMSRMSKICSTMPGLKPACSSAISSSAFEDSSGHDLAGMADYADDTKVLTLLEAALV